MQVNAKGRATALLLVSYSPRLLVIPIKQLPNSPSILLSGARQPRNPPVHSIQDVRNCIVTRTMHYVWDKARRLPSRRITYGAFHICFTLPTAVRRLKLSAVVEDPVTLSPFVSRLAISHESVRLATFGELRKLTDSSAA